MTTHPERLAALLQEAVDATTIGPVRLLVPASEEPWWRDWLARSRAALAAVLSPPAGPEPDECAKCGDRFNCPTGHTLPVTVCRNCAGLTIPAFVGIDQKPDGCWMACMASLTGIPLDEFPDVPPGELVGQQQSDLHNAVTKVLHAHGWQKHHIYTIPGHVPRGWAIAGGPSPRNHERGHAVVVFDGELVFDPHPSHIGLAATETYEILVPVRAGNALPQRASRSPSPPSPETPR